MNAGALGKVYEDGDELIRQGEMGSEMYAILEGQVEVLVEKNGETTRVAVVGPAEFVGEMAAFEQKQRSATVRAMGRVRALTLDRKNLLSRVSEDPTMAFRLIRMLCNRIRLLDDDLAQARRS